MADWFFEQHEFIHPRRHVALGRRATRAPPLRLTESSWWCETACRRHELAPGRHPPPAWGSASRCSHVRSTRLLAAAGDWQRWKGSLTPIAVGRRLRICAATSTCPFEIGRGSGALRAWVDWDQGVARAVTLDAAAARRVGAAGRRAVGAGLQRVRRPSGGRTQRDGVKLQLQHAELHDRRRLGLAAANLKPALAPARRPCVPADAPATASRWPGGEFSADRLDLALMSAMAERLADRPRRCAACWPKTRPRRSDRSASRQLGRALDAPQRYKVRATVRGMAIAGRAVERARSRSAPAGAARPGDQGRRVRWRGQPGCPPRDGWSFPAYSSSRVPLSRFSASCCGASMARRRTACRASSSTVSDAQFENDDAQGQLEAVWRTGPSPASAKAHVIRRARARRPAQRRPGDRGRYCRWASPTRRGIGGARGAGRCRRRDPFPCQGRPVDFPSSTAATASFRIAGTRQGRDAGLCASEPAGAHWCGLGLAVAGVSARCRPTLVFDRNAMQINNASGRLSGAGAERGARRHSRLRRSAAGDRRPRARPAGRPAAL